MDSEAEEAPEDTAAGENSSGEEDTEAVTNGTPTAPGRPRTRAYLKNLSSASGPVFATTPRPSPRKSSPGTLRLRDRYPDARWNPGLTRSISRRRTLEKKDARNQKEYRKAYPPSPSPPFVSGDGDNTPFFGPPLPTDEAALAAILAATQRPTPPGRWWEDPENFDLSQVFDDDLSSFEDHFMDVDEADAGTTKAKDGSKRKKTWKGKGKAKATTSDEEEEEEEEEEHPIKKEEDQEEPEIMKESGEYDDEEEEEAEGEEEEEEEETEEVEEDIPTVIKRKKGDDDDDDDDRRGAGKSCRIRVGDGQFCRIRLGDGIPPVLLSDYESDPEDVPSDEDMIFQGVTTSAYKTKLNKMLAAQNERLYGVKGGIPALPAPPIPLRRGIVNRARSPTSPPIPSDCSDSSGSDFAQTTELAKKRRAHKQRRSISDTEDADNDEDEELAQDVVPSSPPKRSTNHSKKIANPNGDHLPTNAVQHTQQIKDPRPTEAAQRKSAKMTASTAPLTAPAAPNPNPHPPTNAVQHASIQEPRPTEAAQRKSAKMSASTAPLTAPAAPNPNPHPPTNAAEEVPVVEQRRQAGQTQNPNPNPHTSAVGAIDTAEEPISPRELLAEFTNKLEHPHSHPTRENVEHIRKMTYEYLEATRAYAEEHNLSMSTVHKIAKTFARGTPAYNAWNNYEQVSARTDREPGESRVEFIRRIKKKYKAKTNPETNSPEEIQEFLDEIEDGMVELLMEPDVCCSPYTTVEAAIEEVRDLFTRLSIANPLLGLFGVATYAGQDQAARQLGGALTGSATAQQVLNEHPEHIQTVVNTLTDLHCHFVNMRHLERLGLSVDQSQEPPPIAVIPDLPKSKPAALPQKLASGTAATKEKVPAIKKGRKKKAGDLTDDEEMKDIKLRAEVGRLKKEGTKTTHEARKVATFDLRTLLGKYMPLKTRSITWSKLADQLAENELTIVWPLQGARQYPSDFWDISTFGMGEWKILQDALADGSLELRKWTEEQRGYPEGSWERGDIPIVLGISGVPWWSYRDTKRGKAEEPEPQSKPNVVETQSQCEDVEMMETDHCPQAVAPPVSSLPPPIPFTTKPTSVNVVKQPQPYRPAESVYQPEELEAEIKRLSNLLIAEKLKPANPPPDDFSHYEIIPHNGVGTGNPNELYEMPEIRVVRRATQPLVVPPSQPRSNLAVDTSAYHKAMTGPYRGELAGGSTSKSLAKKQANTVSPFALYGGGNRATPPSARALTRKIPGHHPSIRSIPQLGGLTRGEQHNRMTRAAPSKSTQRAAVPTQHPEHHLAPVPPRFDQQRYLRDNTAGPSCEVFLKEKTARGDTDMA